VETPVGLHLCSSVAEQAYFAPLWVVAQGFANHQIDTLRLKTFGFDCKVVSYLCCIVSNRLLTPIVEHPNVSVHILREHLNLEQVRRPALLRPVLQQLFMFAVSQHSVGLGRFCMINGVGLAKHIVRHPAI
jgi:hypothetical protein